VKHIRVAGRSLFLPSLSLSYIFKRTICASENRIPGFLGMKDSSRRTSSGWKGTSIDGGRFAINHFTVRLPRRGNFAFVSSSFNRPLFAVRTNARRSFFFFARLAIIPSHKSDRCRRDARRNLSQSGHRNLCYLKQTLPLWSPPRLHNGACSSDSALIPLDVDGVLFPRARFPPGPLPARARRKIWQEKGRDCNETSTRCLSFVDLF